MRVIIMHFMRCDFTTVELMIIGLFINSNGFLFFHPFPIESFFHWKTAAPMGAAEDGKISKIMDLLFFLYIIKDVQ